MVQKSAFSVLTRLFFVVVAVGIGAGGVHYLHNQSRLRKLQKDLQLQKKKLKEARKHITNLLGEKRVAEIVVLDQKMDESGTPVSKIRFLEYSASGTALKPPKEITVSGAEVYFDAVIIMFEKEPVMQGKAASIHLFRRIFTDTTKPEKGYRLWNSGGDEIPEAYRSPEIPLEIQNVAWGEIRRILTNETYRKEKGVRTIFGQAVSKKLHKGRIYTLRIQSNGGLLMEQKAVPAILE